MAVDSKPYTHCESSNDSDGDGDHRIEPRKHREGEDTWRNSAKSCIEVVILDRVFEDAEAIVVGLDTEFGHGGCWEGPCWKPSWEFDRIRILGGGLDKYK